MPGCDFRLQFKRQMIDIEGSDAALLDIGHMASPGNAVPSTCRARIGYARVCREACASSQATKIILRNKNCMFEHLTKNILLPYLLCIETLNRREKSADRRMG